MVLVDFIGQQFETVLVWYIFYHDSCPSILLDVVVVDFEQSSSDWVVLPVVELWIQVLLVVRTVCEGVVKGVIV